MSNKNPFLSDDELVVWLKDTKDFQQFKASASRAYVAHSGSETKKQPFLFSMSKSFNHFTRLSFLGAFLAILATSGVAAQVFAQEQYKPSTIVNSLFSANKQKDSNPAVAVSKEVGTKVATLDTCNLALKYPETINGKAVEFRKIDGKDLTFGSYQIGVVAGSTSSVSKYDANVEVECGTTLYNNGSEQETTTNLTTDELRNQTGWFITNGDLKNITLTKLASSNSDAQILNFNLNDLKYSVTTNNLSSLSQFIKNSDIQLQLLSDIKSDTQGLLSDESQKSCNKLDVATASNIKSFNSQATNYDVLHYSNYDFSGFPDDVANPALIAVFCYNEKGDSVWSSNQGGAKNGILDQNGITKSDKSQIPFITDKFRSTISDKVYVIGLSEKRGQVDYYFEDKDGNIYQISFNNQQEIQKSFGLTIDLK